MQARHGLDATLRSNPVYGDDSASTPTARGIGDDYAPKSFGAMRSAPLAGLPIDSGLPPVGDLFSPQPRLPLSVRLATQSFSPATAPGPAPSFAPWDVSRPFLAGTFLLGDAPAPAPGQALESYPPRVQESLLVDDLLHAFDGLSGTWVRAKLVEGRGGPRLEYRIAARGQLEPALMEMASRMLPLCECVAVVQRYVETRRGYEWGLVCQALAGAMRQVVQDWQLMLAQLEHQLKAGKLTMQALWYYVQPPMAAMRLVATIAADASFKQARGAALLNLLHAKAAGLLGDAAAHRLALRLLRAAAEPYFAMLERWLCEGVVDDPYGEFMVQEDGAISNADLSADGGSAFWAEKFMLRIALDPGTGAPLLPDASGATVHDVPVFLAKSKAAILNTGKYLNLVRSCGRQPQRPLPLGMHLGKPTLTLWLAAHNSGLIILGKRDGIGRFYCWSYPSYSYVYSPLHRIFYMQNMTRVGATPFTSKRPTVPLPPRPWLSFATRSASPEAWQPSNATSWLRKGTCSWASWTAVKKNSTAELGSCPSTSFRRCWTSLCGLQARLLTRLPSG